jgi:hypothetical protein
MPAATSEAKSRSRNDKPDGTRKRSAKRDGTRNDKRDGTCAPERDGTSDNRATDVVLMPLAALRERRPEQP